MTCSYCEKPPPVANISTNNKDNGALLLTNLQHYGWSPISIDHDDDMLTIGPPTQQTILNLFQSSSVIKESKYSYRADAESGGQGIEPKESLEVKVNDLLVEPSSSQQQALLIDQWCLALYQIAHRVCQCLDIPSDTMLCSQNTKTESLDLMRVFYYHATETPHLGSSPHTDWGSWTIVWQDSVGGLETYCRRCQQWVPVPAAVSCDESSTTSWNCIVHVGDMASLAFQHPDATHNNEANTTTSFWPSPKHRVLTSTNERASLVYFGYPPARASMKEIREALKDWKLSHRGNCLPLQEYYLLQDQSQEENTSKNNETTTTKEASLYSSIESLSIQEMIQAKWNQVQRA